MDVTPRTFIKRPSVDWDKFHDPYMNLLYAVIDLARLNSEGELLGPFYKHERPEIVREAQEFMNWIRSW